MHGKGLLNKALFWYKYTGMEGGGEKLENYGYHLWMMPNFRCGNAMHKKQRFSQGCFLLSVLVGIESHLRGFLVVRDPSLFMPQVGTAEKFLFG